ncbi:mucosa-associated lymphoid tissue lymphoma translocation protein 1-like isoform X2 [Protopterus annectens]|uniref:mucosa-associated lymphoid tissue lymphoma translocation protein 1-like isoform X2 n=1 Tax=Protopterus annectens TaxID=7888 RepID=UPI001CFBBE0F|nr:mucosa-associated lymphoid tissue lymphoma translocation protein 1-like isoform X2 [Protopterus annectens]
MLKEIVITEQPTSASVPPDYPVVLHCRAVCPTEAVPLQYQWFLCQDEVPGATQPDLQVIAKKTQVYVCRINDRHGNAKFSNWVKIRVIPDVKAAILPDLWQGEPVIVMNCTARQVKEGHTLRLQCTALGIPAPTSYQWYRNGNPLQNQNSKELQIKAVKSTDQGTYLCSVSNCRDPSQERGFFATDKVALLIGNNSYINHPNLLAPMMDVFELAALLRQLNFRVVSLLDLNKSEMSTAIEQFLQLLDKGVYAVFYYAGHGYERSGRNYMVPVEAPQPYRPEDCISVQSILQKMQRRQTALNVVLLDTCRKWYNSDCPLSEVTPLEPLGNTVFAYATSEDAEAYEVQDGECSSGIFMKYLKKHILEDKKVSHILEEVLEDIGKDPLVTGKQVMEIKHTLKEGRSLSDKIHTSGHTVEFRLRNELWQQAIEFPKKKTVQFPSGVQVELSFSAVFSNLMHVFAKTKITPNVSDCRVLMFRPPDLPCMLLADDSRADSLLASADNDSDSVLRLCGLQKLQSDLIIKVDLHYRDLGSKQRVQESVNVNLRKPLVAKLFSCKKHDCFPVHEKSDPVAASRSQEEPRCQRVMPCTSGQSRPGTRQAGTYGNPPSAANSTSKSREPEENDESEDFTGL